MRGGVFVKIWAVLVVYVLGLALVMTLAHADNYRYGTGPSTVTPTTPITVQNDVGGTILNSLAVVTGAGKVQSPGLSTADKILGIVTAGAGTSGSATLYQQGVTNCNFDGATTAGDYVTISTVVAGDCTDAGTVRPHSQTIGFVLSTNGSAGLYAVNVQIGGGVLGGGAYYADSFTGTDDCVRTNAAITTAIAAGGGTVFTPGYPGKVAVCTTPIAITHAGTIAPVSLVINELLRWTSAAPTTSFITDTNPSPPPGSPNDTIQCATSPQSYSVTNGVAPVTGFDYEPTGGSTPVIEFGVHAGTQGFINLAVLGCGFMGNSHATSGIVVAGNTLTTSRFIGNGGWAVSSGNAPSGTFIATDATAGAGAWDQNIFSRNFTQNWNGGLLFINAFGAGGGGSDNITSNFCVGQVSSYCYHVGGLFDPVIENNQDFGGTLASSEGEFEIFNSSGVTFNSNHVDSVSPAAAATGTMQLYLFADSTVAIGSNTLNGNTTAGANRSQMPAYGVYIDPTTSGVEISPGLQCLNTATDCIHNLGKHISYAGIVSTANDANTTAGMEWKSPALIGIASITDYEAFDTGNAFGNLNEFGGYGIFDGLTAWAVNHQSTLFGAGGVRSFLCAFRTTTTLGGIIAFWSPTAYVDGANGNTQSTIYMTTDGKVHLSYNSTGVVLNSTAAYNDGATHLLAVTLENGGGTPGAVLYVDGASVASSVTSVTDTFGKYLIVGNGNGAQLLGISSLNAWQAFVDYIADWEGTLLSAGQIAGITQTIPETTVPTGGGTVAALTPTYYWPFDADTISQVASGQSFLGTVTTQQLTANQLACTVATPTYGTTVTPNMWNGCIQAITVTNGTAWTLANPLNPVAGGLWQLINFNNSGGAEGAITLGANYHADGSWIAPANGKRRICWVTNVTTTLALINACSADE